MDVILWILHRCNLTVWSENGQKERGYAALSNALRSNIKTINCVLAIKIDKQFDIQYLLKVTYHLVIICLLESVFRND